MTRLIDFATAIMMVFGGAMALYAAGTLLARMGGAS